MKKLLSNFKIEISDKLYLKDPETSDLGKRIIEKSIELISKLGFEEFNFKKLGVEINSNESSIYRYFESKHNLLMYLTSWYWIWIEYQLVIETYALKNKQEKLIKSVEILTRATKKDSNFSHINEVLLNEIIIHENAKSYLTKEVDNENKDGFFSPYKRVVKRLANVISEFNNNYEYPLNLANTIVGGALQQHFFQQHFKTITNCDLNNTVTSFYVDLIQKTLGNGK